MSPQQWHEIERILSSHPARHEDQDAWDLTLTCGHTVRRTQHRDHDRYGHPEAEAVAVAVAELAESGAALTAARVVDLKVTLWRSRPLLWRTVRMPLAATLGDLHRAIQVLFDWDGDHLHAFTVAGARYSDPFFDLEETADEEAVRLRDAFPASARKPVRYEYDFGAGWVHEVTRTGSSRLAPGEAVPRCLSFSGDNPVEYWDEDEPADSEPFNMAEANAALAS
jgi:hypothetical protein